MISQGYVQDLSHNFTFGILTAPYKLIQKTATVKRKQPRQRLDNSDEIKHSFIDFKISLFRSSFD